MGSPCADAGSSDYKVVFDETRLLERSKGGYFNQISETEWYGGSYFADVLRRNGFSVSKISTKPITYEKLRGYDVLIILSSDGYYTDDEIDAIEKFVKNGGGLLLARTPWRWGDYYASNGIAKRFGVSFAKGGHVCDATDHYGTGKKHREEPKISDIKSHEITKGVSSFYLPTGTYIRYIGSSNVLAYSDSDSWFDEFGDDDWGNNIKERDEVSGPFPVLSEMSYGSGRIVFIGSNYAFINDWIEKLDNERLGLNIVKWLAEPAKPTPTPVPTPITGPDLSITLLGNTEQVKQLSFDTATEIKICNVEVSRGAILQVSVKDDGYPGDYWTAAIYDDRGNLLDTTTGDGSITRYSAPASATIGSGRATVKVYYTRGIDKFPAGVFVKFKSIKKTTAPKSDIVITRIYTTSLSYFGVLFGEEHMPLTLNNIPYSIDLTLSNYFQEP